MMMLSEESRRMQDMMKMYNMYGMDPSMFGGTGDTGAECQPSTGTVSLARIRSLNMQQ